MTRLVVVLPPLPLSRDFVDTPYLLVWNAYLAAAVARQAGAEVQVLDGMAAPGLGAEGDGLWLGQARADFLGRLEGVEADVALIVGSPFLIQRRARPWLASLLRALPAPRVTWRLLADMYAGGSHYLDYDGAALRRALPALDLLLRFEGESLLADVLAGLRAGRELPTGERAQRAALPLKGLPPPAWDLMDHEAYFDFLAGVLASPLRAALFPATPRRTLPLLTARGCSFGCTFCTRNPGLPAPRRQVRVVAWEEVRGWVSRWARELGIERLVVLDEVPNLSARRFDALLALAEEHDLRLEFPNGLRADRLSEVQLGRLAARSSRLKISLESASARVQREILDKGLAPEAVSRVAATCRRLGLPLQVHGLIGLPGETRVEVLETLSCLQELHAAHGAEPLVQFPVPLPGSDLAAALGPGGAPPAEELPYEAFQREPWPMPGAPPAGFLRAARRELERQLMSGPSKLIVNLTYQCNNRCVFCAVGDRPPRHAAREEVERLLRENRSRGLGMLDLDGGEPTLHPALIEVVAAARALGFRPITLITNGRRLTYRAFADRLAAAGLDQVLISLHGPDAGVHEALTRAPGSFAQTWSGLGHALEVFGPARVAVNTTLWRENLAHLPALAGGLAAQGVGRWNLQVATPFGRARGLPRPPWAEVVRALEAVLGAPPAGLTIAVINCPACRLPGREELAAQDFAKRDRDMAFVGEAGTNLQAFLAGRRRRLPACAGCAYSLTCAGDWDFGEEPA